MTMRRGTLLVVLGFVAIACAHERATSNAPVDTWQLCPADEDNRGRVPAWECGVPTQPRTAGAVPAAKAAEPAAVPPSGPTWEPPPPAPPGDFRAQVVRVQELVGDLSDPGWTVACTRASDALDALASALSALKESDRRVGRAARNVWADARALRRVCSGSFEAADLIRSGLETSLEGLERALGEGAEDARLKARLRLARTSVEALDPDSSWVFQRARVQDAFRTVSSAFVAASEQPTLSDARAAEPEAR
jgi:hypothetical protein